MYLVRFVWVGLLLIIRTNGLQAQLELPTTARRRTPVARPVPTLVKFLCQTMRNTQTKYWFFTSSKTEEPPYDSSSMTYLIAGRETCPDTDTSTGSAISNSKRSNLAEALSLKLPTTARRRTPIP
jgi:hypothetical protein